MACSSRISRIVPTGLPLTWDVAPAEYPPLSPPSLPFADSKPVATGCTHRSLRPREINGQRSARSPLSTISSISTSTRPFNFLSLKSPRSDAEKSARNQDGDTYEDSRERSNSRRYTPSKVAPEKQRTTPTTSSRTHRSKYDQREKVPPHTTSSRTHRSKYDQREKVPPHVKSSPTLSTPAPSETPWMKVASSLHRGYGREDEPSSTEKPSFTKTHRHKYSHVVQTDALAPDPSWTAHSNCKSSHPQANQQQPWVTESHEIDWAAYYSIKPLPASVTWSRPGANVRDVDGPWTGAAKTISP